MHLSMPSSVHSVSCWHGLHSWFEIGTHTYDTWSGSIAPSTPKQPQPGGHVPHSMLHTPPVPTRMQMSDWHCMLSVHGSPKPLSIASGGPSGVTPASSPDDASTAHGPEFGSHGLLLECAHATSKSPPSRTRPSIVLEPTSSGLER